MCKNNPDKNNPDMKSTQPTTDRQPAIIRSESMALITDSLPQTHKTNTGSADRCNRAINELIRDIEANGMNDELDRKAALYIARTNVTVKQMAERRSPYTKLFDQIRSEFTKLEKSIEPGIQGTPAHRLQQLRDSYARQVHERQLRARKAEEERLAMQAARAKYRADADEAIAESFNALVTENLDRMSDLVAKLSPDTYQAVHDTLSSIYDTYPEDWTPACSIQRPYNISEQEAADIRTQVIKALTPRFREQYRTEIEDYREQLFLVLPSKLAELQRAAEASAEEAEKIKADMQQREAEEQQRKQREREAKAEELRKKAELDKANADTLDRFARTSAPATTAAKVTKKIRITDPQAILSILTTWWQREGASLTVDELTKIFKKQLTYCEKLANKENFLIEGIHGLEYTDEIKAK